MNKNANSVRHLQNAAIAVLTVSAVFLLVQTPLVGDLAGKTPYELAQDWLAGDTSAETSVATDLTELALPVRVAFTNEYARYGLSAITTLDADFELAGAFFSEALDSAGVYEACSGEKLLAALHASSIYLDLETPTPLNVLSKILGVADAPESSLMHVTRLLLYPAESGTTLYLQDTDQGFFFSKTSVSSTALREASLRSTATEPILLSLSPVILPTSRPTRSFQRSAAALCALRKQCAHRSGSVSAPCRIQPSYGKRLHRFLWQHRHQGGLRHTAHSARRHCHLSGCRQCRSRLDLLCCRRFSRKTYPA